jgi:hypothetical protein
LGTFLLLHPQQINSGDRLPKIESDSIVMLFMHHFQISDGMGNEIPARNPKEQRIEPQTKNNGGCGIRESFAD